jgi:hypothetical protein
MNASKWLVMACALVAMTASAGTRGGEEVYVDNVSRVAYGSMTGAYNSADPYQLIYCKMRYSFLNYGSFTVSCAARNASGTWGACTTPLMGDTGETRMREMLATIDEHSIIEFGWDSSGYCTYIDVRRSSHPSPKRTQ